MESVRVITRLLRCVKVFETDLTMAQVMNTCSEVMPKRGQASAPEEPGYYDDISDTDELEAEDINR